jgi:hypothetical protein
MLCSISVWRGTIQEKGVVGVVGVGRLGLAADIGSRPEGIPSNYKGDCYLQCTLSAGL